jgi:hypothetical protein
MPELARHLTGKMKKSLLWSVSIESATVKLQDFSSLAGEMMIRDMGLQQRLASNPVYGYFAQHEEQLLDLGWLLAVVVNIVMIASYTSWQPDVNNPLAIELSTPALKDAVRGLGWALAVVEIILLILFIVRHSVQLSLSLFSSWEHARVKKLADRVVPARALAGPARAEAEPRAVRAGGGHRPRPQRHVRVVRGLRGHGPVGQPLAFTWHLFSIVSRVESLKTMVRAVTSRANQLLSIGMMGLFFLHIWAAWNFVGMRRFWALDGREPLCGTLSTCFASTLSFGLRSGGGQGDYIVAPEASDSWFWPRAPLDVAFFVIVSGLGALAIGVALTVNTAITELNLRANDLSDAGAQAIGASLMANSAVTALELGSNRIGDDGARAIGEALRVNTAVTKLSLQGNPIGDEGIQAVADGLLSPPNIWLMDLLLGRVHFQASAILERNKSLKQTRTMQHRSLFAAFDDPATLPFEGWDVYRDLSPWIKRAILGLDYLSVT